MSERIPNFSLNDLKLTLESTINGQHKVSVTQFDDGVLIIMLFSLRTTSVTIDIEDDDVLYDDRGLFSANQTRLIEQFADDIAHGEVYHDDYSVLHHMPKKMLKEFYKN